MSKLIPRISVEKISTEADRKDALEVIEEVYLKEKKWVDSIEEQLPAEVLGRENVSWFLARVNNKPAGVLRLLYDPVMDLPEEYGVTLNEGIDLTTLSREYKFVEIGRFSIKPRYRRNIFVALRLMRAAIKEVIDRNYTHFITDVFEGEPNSPFNFHTRILGFEVIGRHLHGDLHCSCTRIILMLDIVKAYTILKQRKSRIISSLTEGLEEYFEKKLGQYI